MKLLKLFLVLLCALLFATPANAYTITNYSLITTPGDYVLVNSGNQTSQAEINAIIGPLVGDALYSASPGGGVEGALAGAYVTTFSNTPEDPSDALIEHVVGEPYIDLAYLLVKDGNHSPAWYLIRLTTWNGTDDLILSDFWSDGGGAISHVSLYGTPVPEPATMLLLGSGLLGLAGFGRKKLFKR